MASPIFAQFEPFCRRELAFIILGYEPADLTVHPPRTVEGGFIFFRIGV